MPEYIITIGIIDGLQRAHRGVYGADSVPENFNELLINLGIDSPLSVQRNHDGIVLLNTDSATWGVINRISEPPEYIKIVQRMKLDPSEQISAHSALSLLNQIHQAIPNFNKAECLKMSQDLRGLRGKFVDCDQRLRLILQELLKGAMQRDPSVTADASSRFVLNEAPSASEDPPTSEEPSAPPYPGTVRR